MTLDDDEEYVPEPVSPLRLAVGLLAIVGAVAFAIAVWVFRPTGSPAGTILDLLALGDGGALVVRTTVDAEESRLERLDADGHLLWRADLPPYPWLDTGLPRMTVDEDRLTVRSSLPDGTVVGLDLRSGERVFSVSPVDRPDGDGQATDDPFQDEARLVVQYAGSLNVPPSATAPDGLLLEAYGRFGAWAELLALRRRDGEIVWRVALDPEARGPAYVRGERIVFVDGKDTRILRIADGEEVAAFATAGEPCVLADRVLYSDGAGALWSVPLGEAAEAEAPPAEGAEAGPDGAVRYRTGGLAPDVSEPDWRLRACGEIAGATVLALEAPGGPQRTLLAATRDRGASFDFRLDLGAWRIPTWGGFDVRSRHPDAYPLSGGLARRFPLILESETRPEAAVPSSRRLVVVDVVDGFVVDEADLPHEMLGAQLLRVDDGTVFYDPATRVTARFGAETGAIDGAARIGSRGYITTWPHHFAAGRLWTHYGVRAGALDERTLAPVHPTAAPWVRALDPGLARTHLGFD